MEKVLILIGFVALYGVSFYFANKLMKYIRKTETKKVADEMVETGEITREQADAIIWLLNYKPRKK